MELQLALRRNEGGCRTPPAPDEAVVRELVLAKSVEAPDLATVKDFLRFKAGAGEWWAGEGKANSDSYQI